MDPINLKSTSYFTASKSLQKSLGTSSYFLRIGHIAHAALKSVGNVFSPLLGCGTRSLLGRVTDIGVNLLKVVGSILLLAPAIFAGIRGVSFFVSGFHDLHLEKYETALKCYGNKRGGAVQKFLERQRIPNEADIETLLDECLSLRSKSDTMDARERYQQFVKKLDELSIKIMELEDSKAKLTVGQTACIAAAKELALDRWSGVDMTKHYEQRIHLATEFKRKASESFESLSFGELPRQMREINQKVKTSSPEHRKSGLALMWQKFCGGPLGIKYYTGTENVPNRLAVLRHKGIDDPIIQMRHGSPTTGTKVDGLDTIAPNYELFIRAARDAGKSVFYTIHQKLQKTSMEDESPRTRAILKLQEKYSNFHAMVQPLDGSFYRKEGKYENQMNFWQLKQALELEFFDNKDNPSAMLPKRYKEDHTYRQRFKEIFDEVHARFFRGQKMLSRETWQDFIHIFYAYQRMDLRTRIPDLGYVVTACKDDLDRGGGQQLLEHTLLLMMEREDSSGSDSSSSQSVSSPSITTRTMEREDSSGSDSSSSQSVSSPSITSRTQEKIKHLRTHTLGAPINVKMVAVVQSRLDPILRTLEHAVIPNQDSVIAEGATFFGDHFPVSVAYIEKPDLEEG